MSDASRQPAEAHMPQPGPVSQRLRFRRLYRRFAADRQAATAVEVALLLPVFLLFIFATLEIGLLLLYHLCLSSATGAGVEYLRRAAMQHQQATEDGLRRAISASFISPTDAVTLKIALVPIPDEDITAAPIVFPIENHFEAPNVSAGQYILAVGYNWNFLLPTTDLLVPMRGGVRQLQNISLAITAVRVTE